MDRERIFRRIAGQARWEYQQAGTEVARHVNRLRRLRARRESLVAEIDSLGREQLQQLESGQLDADQRHHALGLIAELSASLPAWEQAEQQQARAVLEARQALARARKRKEKTEDKCRELREQWQEEHRQREARELEDIYINNHGSVV